MFVTIVQLPITIKLQPTHCLLRIFSTMFLNSPQLGTCIEKTAAAACRHQENNCKSLYLKPCHICCVSNGGSIETKIEFLSSKFQIYKKVANRTTSHIAVRVIIRKFSLTKTRTPKNSTVSETFYYISMN